jgi:hypothetical protein
MSGGRFYQDINPEEQIGILFEELFLDREIRVYEV